MRKRSYEELLDQRLTNEQALAARRHPLSLLLCNIRSQYNVGSIFRTADAALLEEVILCGFTPRPPRREIEKTALGAVDSVPWRYDESACEAIDAIKKSGRKVLALELTEGGGSYDALQASDFPLCLVLGNEVSGIDSEILAVCDGAIEIPMYGVKHSLNVSVATGVAVFAALRVCRESLPAV